MGLIKTLGRYAWRKFALDGVSSSGFHEPEHRDIFAFVDKVDELTAALGPVDKVDSQISGSMIQDCLLGGGFGSRRPDGYGMADHRGVVAQRTWQEVPALAR